MSNDGVGNQVRGQSQMIKSEISAVFSENIRNQDKGQCENEESRIQVIRGVTLRGQKSIIW